MAHGQILMKLIEIVRGDVFVIRLARRVTGGTRHLNGIARAVGISDQNLGRPLGHANVHRVLLKGLMNWEIGRGLSLIIAITDG